jgi:hypothetical protein
MVTRHEVYSFLDTFSNYHQIMIALEDRYNLHHRMGCVHMVSHALRIEKCATNLPMNCKFGFQGIFWCVHEVVFR